MTALQSTEDCTEFTRGPSILSGKKVKVSMYEDHPPLLP